MDARCIRIKKFADTKISGYVWTGPNLLTNLASALNCMRVNYATCFSFSLMGVFLGLRYAFLVTEDWVTSQKKACVVG